VTNPIEDIENEKAQIDMGTMLYRILKGAIEDGATESEAVLVVAAFVVGLQSAKPDEEEGGDS